MDAKNHPTVRRGTGWLRHQAISLAVVMVALALALLLRDPSPLTVLGAVGCVAVAGLSIWFGEKQVKSLRHEYRYEDEEPAD